MWAGHSGLCASGRHARLGDKGEGEGIESVEYTSSNPKGCYEKLLKCKMPEVYAEWERKGEIWKTLTDEEFWAMTKETMETGNRLCDYFCMEIRAVSMGGTPPESPAAGGGGNQPDRIGQLDAVEPVWLLSTE